MMCVFIITLMASFTAAICLLPCEPQGSYWKASLTNSGKLFRNCVHYKDEMFVRSIAQKFFNYYQWCLMYTKLALHGVHPVYVCLSEGAKLCQISI